MLGGPLACLEAAALYGAVYKCPVRVPYTGAARGEWAIGYLFNDVTFARGEWVIGSQPLMPLRGQLQG